jgi:hypothetical protein
MLPKVCTVCGQLSDEYRCPKHRRKRPSSTQRGYDAEYRRARSALVDEARAQGGFMCTWCGGWFGIEDFTADHDPPMKVAGRHTNLVPACQRCNSGRGGARTR